MRYYQRKQIDDNYNIFYGLGRAYFISTTGNTLKCNYSIKDIMHMLEPLTFDYILGYMEKYNKKERETPLPKEHLLACLKQIVREL